MVRERESLKIRGRKSLYTFKKITHLFGYWLELSPYKGPSTEKLYIKSSLYTGCESQRTILFPD